MLRVAHLHLKYIEVLHCYILGATAHLRLILVVMGAFSKWRLTLLVGWPQKALSFRKDAQALGVSKQWLCFQILQILIWTLHKLMNIRGLGLKMILDQENFNFIILVERC